MQAGVPGPTEEGAPIGAATEGLMMLPNPGVSPHAELYPVWFLPGVMSEFQLNTLRSQISEYSKICTTLVQLHHQHQAQLQQEQNGISSQRDTAGTGGKSARQRWTPTPSQLQVLENIFAKGNGTPSKNLIKEITKDLSVHGPIQETNVYNWFQNRKARAKRKQAQVATAAASTGMDGSKQPGMAGGQGMYNVQPQYGQQPPMGTMASQGPQSVQPLAAPVAPAPAQQWAPAAAVVPPVQVTINNRPWEVAGGMLDVRGTFGEHTALYDANNNPIQLSPNGVVLAPLAAGGFYSAYKPADEGAGGGQGQAGNGGLAS